MEEKNKEIMSQSKDSEILEIFIRDTEDNPIRGQVRLMGHE